MPIFSVVHRSVLPTVVDQRGLIIHIKESTLFDPGKDELKPEAMVPLDLIVDQLRNINNDIRVEGHTDNIPINTPKFPLQLGAFHRPGDFCGTLLCRKA